MTITEAPPAAAPAAPAPPDRRRLWTALGVVALLVLAAVIGLVVRARQDEGRPTPSLRIDSGEYGWIGAAAARSRTIDAGPFTAYAVKARRGDSPGFVVWLHNVSSVPQTILGAGDPPKQTATPISITVGSKEPDLPGGSGAFRSPSVTIPPHSYRAVHYYIHLNTCMNRGRQLDWLGLDLKVRVGGVVRREMPQLPKDIGYAIYGAQAKC